MRTNLPQFFLSLLIALSLTLTHTVASSLTTWEQIHQTLNIYALAIDSKTPSLFSQVFTSDAVANYTGALSNVTGRHAISTALLTSVSGLLSQHQLGTCVIDIDQNGQSANSTTYFTASLFGTGEKYPADAYVFLYGQYRDELVKKPAGWKINRRQLVFMGRPVGNASLVSG